VYPRPGTITAGPRGPAAAIHEPDRSARFPGWRRGYASNVSGTGASDRRGIGADAAPDGRSRLLVVAAETVTREALEPQLESRLEGPGAVVHVIAPALTHSSLKHAMGDVDDAIVAAEERLKRSLQALRDAGIEASGGLGESDPMVAIEDALATFPADEIVIVTGADEEGLPGPEGDLFERARARFEPPITHVTIEDREDDREREVVDVERAGSGVQAGTEQGRGRRARNLPPLSARDVGGIVVAVVGTVVLIVLAATCSEVGGDSADWGCVARYILAGGAALVNIAHVVGLMLFESVGYRGLGERFFAHLSLWGTPAAIIVSLLVH
jgi:hypothetical protein